MAVGITIRTYFNSSWHNGDLPVLRAADHAMWLGSSVFDGARFFEGVTPDLDLHCARTNASAEALMMAPTHSVDQMVELIREGLEGFPPGAAVYIRPMYWAADGDETLIAPKAESTRFAVSLEEIPMAPAAAAATLTRTRFRRPVLETAVVNAKAGCLYPNNARMLREARSKGFSNALVLDAMGNVAETATTNVFMVRGGEVFTPIANGTFLAGITRARHISNMRLDGIKVHECVLTYQDFEDADEVFLSGNMSKVTPVTAFDTTQYQAGPIAKRVREMYWDWAASAPCPGARP
ncbi:aminotransferase [Leisingera sp. ANG-M1]|uniref:branched-chain amino acid aminotransferase n=1 Tax=Leisingera sp. ANG-M1 TaxID=1577895 RepID=UPI0005802F7C|nr:branched-chain amino acid aminotransferase [Leisingera sp. ANG-M1]KIC11796.1 aminotransferase [Leisingera sp. ANG-M1]